MLEFFRKTVNNSLAIKALMVLIVAAFLLVGVGDMLRTPTQDYVFKIGGYKCTEQEWQAALNQQIAYISQNMGRQLTNEELVKGGVYQAVLTRMIDRKVVLLEADKIGLSVSDAMVQKSIMEYPAFLNKDGAFDKAIFEKFITQQNISEERFIQMMRDEVRFETLLNTMGSNMLIAPQVVRQLNIASRFSKDVTAFIINHKDYANIHNPKEEDLQETLAKHKDSFMTPELRTVSYITFTPKDVIKEKATVTEQEVKDIYEQRKFMFERPERREVFHIISKSKELAEKARDALTSGQPFEKVMKEYGNKQTEYKMPELTQASVSPEIGEAIFSLQEKEYSQPVQSPMGFHVFMTNKVIASDVAPYEQVKQMLQAQLQEEKEFEQLSTFIRHLDGEITNGVSLEDLANKHAFKQETATLSYASKDDGTVKNSANFMQTAFSSNLNQISSVTPASPDIYFVLRTDSIAPSKQKEFSAIKDEVAAIWKKERIQTNMYKSSQDLQATLMEGKTPNINFKTNIIRIDNNYKGDLPDTIMRDFAALKKGEYSQIALNSNGDYVFIRMGDTYYPEKNEFPDLKKMVQPDRSQGQIIMEQYMAHLRSKYSVDINKSYFEKMKG